MAAKKDRFKFAWDIEPHILLPSQMAARPYLTAEQRLCWAMIEEVEHDLGRPEKRTHPRGRTSNRPSLREEALRYIYADEHYWAFSFENICAQIGIDPDAFRGAIERKGQAA
jgi:hypothetical protein